MALKSALKDKNSHSILGSRIRDETTKTALVPRKEVVLQVNVEKTKYTFMSHYQNAGENHKIKRVIWAISALKMWQSSNIWE